jgi:sterol desaturase/sphingolipid hydroxylase (fatty acid hydroxylase superfamily)
MHSLHHSDENVNVATTVRHFWLESTIKALSVYAIIGVLFRPSGAVLAAYSVLAMWNYMSHSNVRLSFGPCWWLLNSPQYHRIHHSTDPTHFNRNFAGLLPIFDILFGTQYKAAPQEYPRTGLSTGQRPSGLLQAILWPFHFAPD